MKKYILPFVIFTAFSLQAVAQKYHVNEDFNAGSLPSGWETNAISGTEAWKFGVDGHAGDQGNQNLDGTSLAFFDDDSLGKNSTNNTADLVTPVFDNSSDSTTYIEFDYNFRAFGTISTPDSFYVEVYDGSNWNLVFSRTQSDCGDYTASSQCWYTPHALINISAYSNDSCKVRFVFHDGDDWAWYVGLDNVEIYSIFPVDLKVSSLVRPTDGCSFGGTDSVEVAIANLGQDTVNSFSVSYSVDGGTVVTENVTKTIPAFDTITHLFSTTTNMANVASYQVEAYVTNSLDGDHANDTLHTTVVHEPAYTPTYFESFESSAGGWITYGENSSWARGTPSGTEISIAAVGSKAFVTNLSGDYNSLEYSYLESPCFDFSASPGDPLMSFSLALQTEGKSYDYAWMEYTLNNGVTWQKLSAGGPNPQNWYNNRKGQYWEGLEQGWLNVENLLVGLGGEPQVKFRFVLSTDGGTHFEGLGVDGFSIRNPQPIDLAVTELSYPAPGGAPICGYGPSENVILQIENKGQNRVNSFEVGYIIDGSNAYLDTMNIFIDPGTFRTFVHSRPVNLSSLKNYQFTVWVRALNDGFSPNDTLFNLLVSNTRSVSAPAIPYSQNFEAFNAGSVNGQYAWLADPVSANDFTTGWKIGQTTPSANTGPSGDHTSGTGYFAFLEADGANGKNAYMESPCLDLSL
ncbi:MAG: hypothetical protein WD530_07895, partial [Vicingaceae bacterium]